MLKFLLQRPIGVLMSFLAIVIFSLIAAYQLPISLLPSIDVPQIVVKLSYPNASPAEIEQNILRPIRENMLTLPQLKDLESQGSSETGWLALSFDYGTDMSLAYIAVNEKIDQLTSQLPRDLTRPQVVKISTSDIPIVRLQLVPKSADNLLQISELSEKVIKKRLEAIEGVSLIDLNGKQQKIIKITPHYAKLAALGLDVGVIIQHIQQNNQELGAISVKDGQYRYYVKLASKIRTAKDVENLAFRTQNGQIIQLRELAEVQLDIAKPLGYHLTDGKEAIVINIHKQSQAKMTELMPRIQKTVEILKKDYPFLDFELTQDQSILLRAGIDNLATSLVYGSLFAFAVLFVFMGNARTPIIIGISLPVSLVISFFLFYFLKLSINIISLSGLALGLGMLIDNAIIVLDNITRKRQAGLNLLNSCVAGVQEVIAPLISSMLTTLAVFIPLVFLSGLTGALFFDQAAAVAVILLASLLVAFVLLPLIYRLLYQKQAQQTNNLQRDSRLFSGIQKGYEVLYHWIFTRKTWVFPVLLLLIPLSLGSFLLLEKAGLPPITKNDAQLTLFWNEPIDAAENKRRTQAFLQHFEKQLTISEAEIGLQQFLQQQTDNSVQKVLLYFLFENEEMRLKSSEKMQAFLQKNYPQASFKLEAAPNSFDQLFRSSKPLLAFRWRNLAQLQPIEKEALITNAPPSDYRLGAGLHTETAIALQIDQQKLHLYRVNYNALVTKLKTLLSPYLITDLKDFGELTPIQLAMSETDFVSQMQQTYIPNTPKPNEEIVRYPLTHFISYELSTDFKHITADKSGIYQEMVLEDSQNWEAFYQQAKQTALQHNWSIDVNGQLFDNAENLRELLFILLIAVLLLYFILAAQFESFLQPLIVLLTLPLGMGGSMLVLWLSQTSLNIMSLIGMVVMLGVMVNDAILKIDTINRLRKSIPITEAIHRAGMMRLKPILMTSITTILAVLPVVFASGIGAELQRPLVFAVIGGLSLGTFTAVYFIPLAYFYLDKWTGRKSH